MYKSIQAHISSFLLYHNPSELNLPSVLIENKNHSSQGSYFSDTSSCHSYSRPLPGIQKPTRLPMYYGANRLPKAPFKENRSQSSTSLPSLMGTSLDSDGANSISSFQISQKTYADIPGMNPGGDQPLFTVSQSKKQTNRQREFLRELEEEKKKNQETIIDKEEKERFSSNQLGSPRDSTSHRSVKRSSTDSSSDSEDSIAEENITPRDQHVEKQEKKKKFWSFEYG